jgi:hypothetical protein
VSHDRGPTLRLDLKVQSTSGGTYAPNLAPISRLNRPYLVESHCERIEQSTLELADEAR